SALVPTVTQDRLLSIPAPGSPAPPPAYFADERRDQRLLATVGGVLLGAVSPPTPPEASTCSYAKADLTATLDAPLTQEIRDLAASLQYSTARIFRYVSEQIAFQPYYGSLKG